MKSKLLLAISCLILVTLLFAGCKEKESESNAPCNHSFDSGVCSLCGERDPNFKPDDSENGENPDEEQTPDDNENKPTVPPVNMGDETELPFVPAG
jgi:hypothetical protein